MLSLGGWKNIEDLEDNLTQEEVFGLIKTIRDKEERLSRMIFASQGIDVEAAKMKSKMEAIHKRADVKRQEMLEEIGFQTGFNPETASLGDLGIEIEVEGE